MRTSVVIAFLAASFIAVLAAPHPQIRLQHSPRKIAPKAVDLPELVAAISKTYEEILACLARAEVSIGEALKDSPVHDEILTAIKYAEEIATSIIDRAAAEAIVTPVDDLPPLVLATIQTLTIIFYEVSAGIQQIVDAKDPSRLADVQAIVELLVEESEAALAPLLALLVGRHHSIAPKITLPELIELIRVATADIKAGIEVAAGELAQALAGTKVVDQVLATVYLAEELALLDIEQAIIEALNAREEDLPELLEYTLENLRNLLTVTIAKVQRLVAEQNDIELVKAVEGVVGHLAVAIAAAMQPIVDALNP